MKKGKDWLVCGRATNKKLARFYSGYLGEPIAKILAEKLALEIDFIAVPAGQHPKKESLNAK